MVLKSAVLAHGIFLINKLRGPSLVALVAAALLAAPLRAQSDLNSLLDRASHGEPAALNALGDAYANGTGVPADPALALRNYQQAADLGYGPAQFFVFHVYGL